jgi:YaiO family outer membrane protein
VKRCAGWWLVLLLAGPLAHAQDADAPRTEVGLSTERSDLDRGYADWTEQSLRVQRHHGARDFSAFALTRTSRFGLDDTQFELTHERALSPAWVAGLSLTVSPTHRVLPRIGLAGRLQYEFAPAWLLHLGARHTRYRSSEVDRLDLGLERYVGDFSHALRWSPVRALGRSEQVLEWRSHWYPAEGRSLGLIVAAGDEATELGAGNIALARVRSLALVARWRLDDAWTLTGSLSRTRQGDFYVRTGVGAGVQRRF